MKQPIVILCLLSILSCAYYNSESAIIDKAVPLENRTERQWEEGWLAVPENRKIKGSNTIELPFVLSKVHDSLKNDDAPVLIMSGGPGNGSLHMANGSPNTSWGKNRDLLVMEQRGTLRSNPSLMCPELDSLRIQGLKAGLYGKALDSLKSKATSLCYERLTTDGIDLNGYHTLESVEDIEALRSLLQLDQLILYGMSYSCNLMSAYARKYPQHVKAVILDSPLPHQSNHDEEVHQNIDSTLVKVIRRYKGNGTLYDQWASYMSVIRDSVFEIEIDSVTYAYTKNELIDIPLDAMSSHGGLRNVVPSIEAIISGDHSAMKEIMGYYLGRTRQAKGMRYSVWVGEELPEENPERIEANMNSIDWIAGYAANDINFETKIHWPVDSIYNNWTWPEGTYEGPTLILSGEFDPWTPVWYGKMLLPLFPKATHSIYPENSHLPGFTRKGTNDIADFLNKLSQN